MKIGSGLTDCKFSEFKVRRKAIGGEDADSDGLRLVISNSEFNIDIYRPPGSVSTCRIHSKNTSTYVTGSTSESVLTRMQNVHWFDFGIKTLTRRYTAKTMTKVNKMRTGRPAASSELANNKSIPVRFVSSRFFFAAPEVNACQRRFR